MNYSYPVQALVWPHFGRMHTGVMVRTGYEPAENILTFVIVRGSSYPERLNVDPMGPCQGMCPLLEPHVHVDTDHWIYHEDLDAWVAPEPEGGAKIRKGTGWFARMAN